MQPEDFVPNVGQLEDVRLTAVEFQANEAFDPAIHAVQYSLTVGDADVVISKDRSELRVALTLNWEAVDDRPFERPFDLSVSVAGGFRWGADMDEGYRRGWTEFNGVYLIWPYMRSYITTLTVTAGFHPLVLPTLAIPRVSDEQGTTGEFDLLAPPPSEGAGPSGA